jgi:predicted ArsR family transcriptional regulator
MTQVTKRGRPATFATKKDIVKVLTGEKVVSRQLQLQLVEQGYLKVEKVKSGGVGRPAHEFVVSGKGKGLIALSRNWK